MSAALAHTDTRHCGRCSTDKPAEAFSPTARWCRACLNTYYRAKRGTVAKRPSPRPQPVAQAPAPVSGLGAEQALYIAAFRLFEHRGLTALHTELHSIFKRIARANPREGWIA